MSRETKREILGVSPMSYKFQITVPKKVREKMKLKGGDSVAFVEEGGRFYVTKSTEV
jgi:AbrB family looped-hinge helix DNA binding protein